MSYTLWERHGKIRKLLLFSNPRKRAVICLWKRLYEDSRTLGLSIALTQAEVAEMLEALGENDHRGLSPSNVAIIPRDLAVPISKENAAFVHKKTRSALVSKLKQARKLCGLDVKPEAWKGFLPQRHFEAAYTNTETKSDQSPRRCRRASGDSFR